MKGAATDEPPARAARSHREFTKVTIFAVRFHCRESPPAAAERASDRWHLAGIEVATRAISHATPRRHAPRSRERGRAVRRLGTMTFGADTSAFVPPCRQRQQR